MKPSPHTRKLESDLSTALEDLENATTPEAVEAATYTVNRLLRLCGAEEEDIAGKAA